jgi:hypothetical protein
MSRVIIPIADHVSGLHNGHLQVINFAKEFPGNPIIKVIKDARNWRQHLTHGGPFIPQPVSPKMYKDINKINVPMEEVNVQPIPEPQRAAMYKKASALVSLYNDALLLDEYKWRATVLLMGLFAFTHSTISRSDVYVRGPELVSFFQNSVRKLIGGPEVKIYSKIIKNKENKIKEQGSLDYLPSFCNAHINRLRSVIDGAKPYFKPGKNHDLIAELNSAYSSKPWNIKAVAVYEGGMVPGRLEMVLFEFLTDRGTSIVEEVDYYN